MVTRSRCAADGLAKKQLFDCAAHDETWRKDATRGEEWKGKSEDGGFGECRMRKGAGAGHRRQGCQSDFFFVRLAWLAGLDVTGHYFATYKTESTSLPMS